MSNKKRVNTKCITSFVTEEIHAELQEITDKKNISLGEYIRECIKFKLSLDNNEGFNKIRRESNELSKRLQTRIDELNHEPTEDEEMLFEKVRQGDGYKRWLKNNKINTYSGMNNY